jgi:hypothetical protein
MNVQGTSVALVTKNVVAMDVDANVGDQEVCAFV